MGSHCSRVGWCPLPSVQKRDPMGSGPSARFGSPPIPGALPTAGLRCGRTVVPGAEVSSISVPPLTKPNLKPPVLLPPSPPPSPSVQFWPLFFSCPSRGQKVAPGASQVLGTWVSSPSAFLRPCSYSTPSLGSQGQYSPPGHVSHVLEASCLGS